MIVIVLHYCNLNVVLYLLLDYIQTGKKVEFILFKKEEEKRKGTVSQTSLALGLMGLGLYKLQADRSAKSCGFRSELLLTSLIVNSGWLRQGSSITLPV